MKLHFDPETKLLCVSDALNNTKEYSQTVGGYNFSSYDKELIVWHKKQFKIVNIKDIGDKMSVIYHKEGSETQQALDPNGYLYGFGLFEGFDEETGNLYNFYPKKTHQELNNIIDGPINICKVFKMKLEDNKSYPGEFKPFNPTGGADNGLQKGHYQSFLFSLTLLYGKLDIKNGELRSIKIHIPLFGQYLKYQKEFDNILDDLNKQGIFTSHTIQESNDGIIYQISSSDYELLQSFSNFYKPIENIEQISKHRIVQETIPLLKEYINTLDIDSDSKNKVINQIDNGVIKILQK